MALAPQVPEELKTAPEPLTPKSIDKEISLKIGRGEFDAALQEADEAAREYQHDVYWNWQFRILAANAQVFRGQFQDAIDRLKQPLPPQLSTGEIAVLRKMNLASAEQSAQRLGAAEVDIAEAERLGANSPPKIVIQVLQVRGNVEMERKRYAQAEKAFRKALQIAKDSDLKGSEPQLLGSLGWVSNGMEHYDEAADRYRAALTLTEATGENSALSTTLGNIASSYAALGDYQNAGDYYRRAEQAALHAGQKAERNQWLSGLAYVYAEVPDYPKAETSANQALALSYELRDPLSTVQSLNVLTEIAFRTDRLEIAEQHNLEALRSESGEFDHGEVVTTELNAGYIAELRGRLPEAEQRFQKIAQDPKARHSAQWESQARLASVYAKERRIAEAEREFRRCLRTVDEAREEVQREESRLSFLSGAISFYGEYIDFLISQGRFSDALQIAETSRARTLAEGLGATNKRQALSFSPTSLRGLSRRLNSTLLCYWMGHQRSHLWVISPDKFSYFLLAGTREIEEELKNYRQVLVSSGDALDPVSSDGEKLYSALLEPAKNLITKNGRVTILPDGNLNGLNFETLIVPGAQPHYWIEDVSITTASSLTLLEASAGHHAPGTKGLLLIGDPEQASTEFPKLPQAGAEIQRVEHYFAPADRQVMEGKQATPAAYLASHPERFSYLHFVTHGTASLTHPLDSAVILSPQGADNIFKLYARDIVTHHLNANLVTISACNGAGIRAYSGEGLVGLSWAFLRAGAHNVIGALWEVNDRSTPQLMDSLYGGLTKGQDPATALRKAKLAFLHSGTVYSKPFYWAPFQLYAGS